MFETKVRNNFHLLTEISGLEPQETGDDPQPHSKLETRHTSQTHQKQHSVQVMRYILRHLTQSQHTAVVRRDDCMTCMLAE